jgi:hypothetical protein
MRTTAGSAFHLVPFSRFVCHVRPGTSRLGPPAPSACPVRRSGACSLGVPQVVRPLRAEAVTVGPCRRAASRQSRSRRAWCSHRLDLVAVGGSHGPIDALTVHTGASGRLEVGDHEAAVHLVHGGVTPGRLGSSMRMSTPHGPSRAPPRPGSANCPVACLWRPARATRRASPNDHVARRAVAAGQSRRHQRCGRGRRRQVPRTANHLAA